MRRDNDIVSRIHVLGPLVPSHDPITPVHSRRPHYTNPEFPDLEGSREFAFHMARDGIVPII